MLYIATQAWHLISRDHEETVRGYCLVHEVYMKGVALVQLSQHAWYLESFHLPAT